jgi:predicted nucleic acid-binding protein
VIVVDTSVWANHLHKQISALNGCLARDEVLQHPFVTGEIAMGNLQSRQTTIRFLESIDAAPVSSDSHLLEFVDINDLGGTGIGFVDAHLLASVALAEARLWTEDKRLAAQADRLGLAFER